MRASAVWSAGQRSLRRGRFTRAWYSRCFWHTAVAGVTGGCAVVLPAQRSSAVVLGVLRSPVPEQPGSVLSHSCDRLFVGLSSECRGRAAPRPGCRCCPGNPPALPELTLNPVGAAGSCGRSHCRQSRWVEGISNSRFAVGERSRSQRWVCAVRVPKWDWGQGATWERKQCHEAESPSHSAGGVALLRPKTYWFWPGMCVWGRARGHPSSACQGVPCPAPWGPQAWEHHVKLAQK